MLFGFSKPAGGGHQLGTFERPVTVDVPTLFQLIEGRGFVAALRAVDPLGVGGVAHRPLHVALRNRDGRRVLIDHMDRARILTLLYFGCLERLRSYSGT